VIKPVRSNTKIAVRWLSETLLTATSDVSAELTVYFSYVYRVHGWNSVDNLLDRLSLHENVTLVVRRPEWVSEDVFRGSVRKCFPLMWKNGRVMLKVSPYLTGQE